MDDHPTFCAEVPHPLLAVYLYWCPSEMHWVLSETIGTTDDPIGMPTLTFGPFDDTLAVAKVLDSLFSLSRLERLEQGLV